MAQKKLLLLLILLFTFSATVHAERSFEFKKEDMNLAKQLARKSRQFGMKGIKEKWIELNQIKAANQAALKEGDLDAVVNPLAANTRLFVFVSSSMGTELLKHYFMQAKRYKATLVFNGLPGGSWHQLSDLIYAITGGSAENSSILLDDTAFAQYQVSSVPSFILSKEANVFDVDGGDKRGEEFDKIVGNIGIKRALEEIADKGDFVDEANQLLDGVKG